MGHNTGLLILNDALHNISQNALQFTEQLVRRASSGEKGYFAVGNHCNAATIFHSDHADWNKVYLVGGNQAVELPSEPLFARQFIEERDKEMLVLRSMADKLGYRLVRK